MCLDTYIFLNMTTRHLTREFRVGFFFPQLFLYEITVYQYISSGYEFLIIKKKKRFRVNCKHILEILFIYHNTTITWTFISHQCFTSPHKFDLQNKKKMNLRRYFWLTNIVNIFFKGVHLDWMACFSLKMNIVAFAIHVTSILSQWLE